MSENSAVRQALLKLQFAHLYPGVLSNEWQPAGLMLEQVNAAMQHRTATRWRDHDALDPAHFAFRGTRTARAKQVARELRRTGGKRQHPS